VKVKAPLVGTGMEYTVAKDRVLLLQEEMALLIRLMLKELLLHLSKSDKKDNSLMLIFII